MRYLAVVLGLAFVVGCQAAPSTGGGTKRDGGTSAPDFAGIPGNGNCGSANQMCCAGQVCDTGLQCNPKTGGCCAATGNQCMGPSECCAGLSCTGNKCCTAIGASCLAPSDCCAGLTCTNNVCDKPSGTCGDVGKACCSPGNTCTSGNVCVMGMCKACGQTGQACCDAMTCNKGLNCTSNVCTAPCGDSGQACCKSGMACKDATLTCDMTTGNCKPVSGATTGGLNQPCTMPGNVCNSGLSCVANKCQSASTCNTVGASCCSGNTCTGGLTCNTGTGKCQMPGSMCTAIQATCSMTSQCCPNLTCTPTIQPDGSNKKSCCVGSGAACPDGDFDCCGYLVCSGGKCTAGADGSSCLSNDDCLSKQCGADGFCTSTAGMCGSLKPVPSACTDTSQCCNGSSCEIVSGTPDPLNCCYDQGVACTSSSQCCGSMSCDTSGTKTCICRKATESCRQSADCCGALICDSGTCRDTNGQTIQPGGICTQSIDCIDKNSTIYFCDGMNGANMTCCTYDLQIPCSTAAECCGGSLCTNVTFLGSNKCCSPVGAFCSVGSDCCGSFSSCNTTTHVCE